MGYAHAVSLKDYKKAISIYEHIETFSENNFLAIYNKSFCYFNERPVTIRE